MHPQNFARAGLSKSCSGLSCLPNSGLVLPRDCPTQKAPEERPSGEELHGHFPLGQVQAPDSYQSRSGFDLVLKAPLLWDGQLRDGGGGGSCLILQPSAVSLGRERPMGLPSL